MITAEIIQIQETKTIGISIDMSLVENKTQVLWQTFIPGIHLIKNRIGSEKISLQVYPKEYYQSFDPKNIFTKWALVPVSTFDCIPDGMSSFVIPSGWYARFHYKGHPAAGASFFQTIFTQWVPKSGYQIDERPHFEMLGDRYDNNSVDSEEDVYIPIVH